MSRCISGSSSSAAHLAGDDPRPVIVRCPLVVEPRNDPRVSPHWRAMRSWTARRSCPGKNTRPPVTGPSQPHAQVRCSTGSATWVTGLRCRSGIGSSRVYPASEVVGSLAAVQPPWHRRRGPGGHRQTREGSDYADFVGDGLPTPTSSKTLDQLKREHIPDPTWIPHPGGRGRLLTGPGAVRGACTVRTVQLIWVLGLGVIFPAGVLLGRLLGVHVISGATPWGHSGTSRGDAGVLPTGVHRGVQLPSLSH